MSFLDLPLELREEIYAHRFSQGLRFRRDADVNSPDGARNGALALLAASSAIREDVTRYVLKHVDVFVDIRALRELAERCTKIELVLPRQFPNITIEFESREWLCALDVGTPFRVGSGRGEHGKNDFVDEVRACVGIIRDLAPRRLTLRIDCSLAASHQEDLAFVIRASATRCRKKLGIVCAEEETLVKCYNDGVLFSSASVAELCRDASLQGLIWDDDEQWSIDPFNPFGRRN